MQPSISIHSVGVMSPQGIGFPAFAAGLCSERAPAAVAPTDKVCGAQPLPPHSARWISDFDVLAHLPPKGMASLDRLTQMSIIATEQALAAGAADLSDAERGRVGVVLGSTGGGFRSIADFIRSTYTAAQPHMVSPMQFPNTVMNCAAAQCAIWHGLRGINSSVCGGELSAMAAMQYAMRMLRGGHAQHMIAGSIEEYSDFMAWSHLSQARPGEVFGEGGAVFMLRQGEPAGSGLATVHGIRSRTVPRTAAAGPVMMAALSREITALLAHSGVDASALRWWSGMAPDSLSRGSLEAGAIEVLDSACLKSLVRIAPVSAERLGNTHGANTALQLASALALAPPGLGLLTATSTQGMLACMLIDKHAEPCARAAQA